MNQLQRTAKIEDRVRMRSKVRAITAGTVVTSAAGVVALTLVLSGNAAADDSPVASTQVTDQPTGGLVPGDSSENSPDGSGDQQLVPAGQQPQSSDGGSHAGSGGS